MENNLLQKIFGAVIPALVIVAAIWLLSAVTDVFDKEPTNQSSVATSTPIILPSEYPDHEAYQSMEKQLKITEDHETYTPKNKPIIGRIKETLVVQGEFSRAYIYIEASVDNGKPLTQWDSVYMTLDGVGGHLFRPSTLKVPGDTITRLLFGLNQMPFLDSLPYSETRTPEIHDWFNLLSEEKGMLEFDAFLSTLRSGGKLDLIEIRYQCEVNSDCSIRREQ